MKRAKVITMTVCVPFIVLLLFAPASAQKKFSHAVERSEDAGRIIAALALLPDTGFPQELMKKAEAVAVFPQIKKETGPFYADLSRLRCHLLTDRERLDDARFLSFRRGRIWQPVRRK